jgi:hypothetical protein
MNQFLALVWVFGFLAAIFFVFRPKPEWRPVSTRKRAALAAVAIFVGLPVLAAIFGDREKPLPDKSVASVAPTVASAVRTSTAKAVTRATPAKAPTPAPTPTKWRYSQDADKMRGTVTTYASLESDSELHFGFPYGTNRATLVIRRRPSDGLNVMLQVKGQFLCSSLRDETVAAKFDDSGIENYSCSEPSDASTGLIFIGDASRFLSRLRHAKTLILEAPFFQAGRQQMDFDVRGLEWK